VAILKQKPVAFVDGNLEEEVRMATLNMTKWQLCSVLTCMNFLAASSCPWPMLNWCNSCILDLAIDSICGLGSEPVDKRQIKGTLVNIKNVN